MKEKFIAVVLFLLVASVGTASAQTSPRMVQGDDGKITYVATAKAKPVAEPASQREMVSNIGVTPAKATAPTPKPTATSKDKGSVTVGLALGASSGASYKNPSLGGFLRVDGDLSRVTVRGTASVLKERKEFNQDGLGVHGRAEVGVNITDAIQPFAGVNIGSQRNSSYDKTGASFGGGVRFRYRDPKSGVRVEPYGFFFAPDSTPNKVKRFGGGVEIMAHQLFVGFEAARLTFDQPYTTPVIHNLTAVGVTFNVGWRFEFGPGRGH